jgi:tetratricopeptide (TPR) repeat protein
MSNYKDKLLELMRTIEEEVENNENAYGCLAEINALVSPILTELDEEDFYLWGLAHYSISSEPTENSMFKFQKALQLNPDYYLARLYLAHCYHDKEEWYDAIEEYLKVDQETLMEEFPIWRTATLNEQIGYCYWQLNMRDEAMRFFERVRDIWSQHPHEDGNGISEFIKPRDMIDCLGVNHPLLEDIDLSKML